MSTRVHIPHPSERKPNYKKNKKQIPKMKDDATYFNILEEQGKKAQMIHSSIQNRINFLNNTDLNNKQNEIRRLYGIYQAGARPHANDNRMKLSKSELGFIRNRGMSLQDSVHNQRPIVGAYGKFDFK